MKQPVLELCEAGGHYYPAAGLANVSLAVYPGECVLLWGPNGSGKSSVLKLVTGELALRCGRVCLLGSTAPESLPYKRQYAYVPERVAFPPEMNGRELLTFFARMQGQDKRRAREVCAEVGLMEVAERRVKKYSLGMQKRLALGQALLADAPLLLLDEPFNALDREWCRWLVEKIAQLCREGRAVLLASHITAGLEALDLRRVALPAEDVHTGAPAPQKPI